MVPPAQYGPVFDAVGVAGGAVTVTFVVAVLEGQPLRVTVTEYVPDAAAVAWLMVGFCTFEVKPFGPVQEYVAPLQNEEKSETVAPTQYGPPLLANVEGMPLTTTLVEPAAEVHPLTVTVTEYVPL